MREDLGLSMRVPASLGDLYASVFALVFVGFLTGIVLVGTGFGDPPISYPVIAVLAVATLAMGVLLSAAVE